MSMRRLVFIVEGRSEERFINKLLIPYLSAKDGLQGIPMHAQRLLTNRKKLIRGGNVSFGKFANDVRNVAASGDVLVTTMIDFFRLPADFPGYTTDSMKVDMIEQAIRDALAAEVDPAIFLPYIQRHEFETLLFSNMDGFSVMDIDEKALAQLESIEQEYANPEDINGGAETAPSKRLSHIFNYEKAADSFSMLSAIPIDTIRAKCPRFNRWVLQLEEGLKAGRFL